MKNSKTCVVTISKGDRPWFKDYAEPHMKAYAESCNADFIRGETLGLDLDSIKEFDEINFGRSYGKWLVERLVIFNHLLKDYDRVLWLDDTCLISQWCPNIFDTVPYGYIGAHNEGPIEWVDANTKTKKLMQESGFSFTIPDYNYFNCGVLLVDKTHQDLFTIESLIKYGKLGYFSDVYVDQTYMNIRVHQTSTPMFYLPELFNKMLIFNRVEDDFNFYSGKPIFNIDVLDACKHINVLPGAHNHAFIWHFTSMFKTELKTKVFKTLNQFGFSNKK